MHIAISVLLVYGPYRAQDTLLQDHSIALQYLAHIELAGVV